MKKVYVPMCADLLHHGHLNIIKEARKYGEVIIGLLTDEAIAGYKGVPLIPYKQRKFIVENIKGIKEVVPQENRDYIPNLRKIKPDCMVHGDDWRQSNLKILRERAMKTLEEWGGKIIEVPYTKNVSSSKLKERLKEIGTTPETRMKKLKRSLELKPLFRVLEVHNGLTGRIVEKTRIAGREDIMEFDGMWLSSLTDSTAKGKPDTGCVDFTSRVSTINQIFEVTTKPLIVDADNGGLTEHFVFMVKTLERLGVSAVIIEDKVGAKRNSLFGTKVEQTQDDITNFCHKISESKKAQVTEDFMIIARIESLILKKGIEDALIRANAYIKAGADAIMIHSKEKDPSEILEFCKGYNKLKNVVPLVVAPTTYNSISEEQLIDSGINIIIYANHLLRSAYPAMVKTAETILKYRRGKEAEEHCILIKDILTLIPGSK